MHNHSSKLPIRNFDFELYTAIGQFINKSVSFSCSFFFGLCILQVTINFHETKKNEKEEKRKIHHIQMCSLSIMFSTALLESANEIYLNPPMGIFSLG